VHGDNNGLVFPFRIAPVQAIIVPISAKKNKKLEEKVKKIVQELKEKRIRAKVDKSGWTLGNKLFYWEMKGVPIRIELGEKELKKGKAIVFRRDTKEKKLVSFKLLCKTVLSLGKEIDSNLKKRAAKKFDARVVKANSFEEVKKFIEEGKIVKANFCSIGSDGENCAERIEKEIGASVRGKRLDEKQSVKGNCVCCSKKAAVEVYIAKQY
jgi:prolyl-tRNA synthetase